MFSLCLSLRPYEDCKSSKRGTKRSFDAASLAGSDKVMLGGTAAMKASNSAGGSSEASKRVRVNKNAKHLVL